MQRHLTGVTGATGTDLCCSPDWCAQVGSHGLPIRQDLGPAFPAQMGHSPPLLQRADCLPEGGMLQQQTFSLMVAHGLPAWGLGGKRRHPPRTSRAGANTAVWS